MREVVHITWKRIGPGEYESFDKRFLIESVYNRSEGGDVWKMRDWSVDPHRPHYRKTLKECKELAKHILMHEAGKIPTFELTEDMF